MQASKSSLNLMARDGLEYRKVVIVDGETHFGGFELSDPYFASDDLFKALDALPASQRIRAYDALWSVKTFPYRNLQRRN